MKIRVRIDDRGVRELTRKTRDLERRASELSGTRSIPLTDLLCSEFLLKYTDFGSVEELFRAGGHEVESQEDFERISDEERDQLARNHTQFSTWDDLIGTAAREWTERELEL